VKSSIVLYPRVLWIAPIVIIVVVCASIGYVAQYQVCISVGEKSEISVVQN